jgi:chromosome segregation ATPase
MMADLSYAIEMMHEQIAEIDKEVADLENDIAQAHRQVATFKEHIKELTGQADSLRLALQALEPTADGKKQA